MITQLPNLGVSSRYVRLPVHTYLESFYRGLIKEMKSPRPLLYNFVVSGDNSCTLL
jgi:hypothetical protein